MEKKNLRLLKVKFVEIKQLIPSVVYPRLMQPHMLQFYIYSIKRKVIPILIYGLGQLYSTSTNRRHGGRSTTLRNQQHENFVKKKYPPFLIGIGTKKNGWDNKHPSRSYFGYPYNHRRLLK